MGTIEELGIRGVGNYGRVGNYRRVTRRTRRTRKELETERVRN